MVFKANGQNLQKISQKNLEHGYNTPVLGSLYIANFRMLALYIHRSLIAYRSESLYNREKERPLEASPIVSLIPY